MPDYAINGIENQTVPERIFCFCMPVMLCQVEEFPDGILIQRFAVGDNGAVAVNALPVRSTMSIRLTI